MEVRRLARDQEVPNVAAVDQDLSARFRAVLALFVRLELRLLARHHVNVAVQEYPWISCPHPHHESRVVTAGPSARIARRLQPARPEPAIDKVHRRLRRARRVRSVAHELAGKRKDLGVLGYYRQILLRSSGANKSSLYFSTPPCRRIFSISASRSEATPRA